MNAAVTVVFAFSTTVQDPVPAQAPPPHPAKTEPLAGVAVSATLVPELNWAAHVAPQLIPDGELETVPVPVPPGVSVRVNCGGGAGLNVAVTDWFEPIVMLQAPVPVHAPLQPLNTCPAAGVAARLTDVPDTNVAEQVAPQLMPAGALLTDPVPVPARVVVNVNSGEKFAVTVAAAFIVTVHVPVPEHRPPPHPVNTEPPAADAVSVTLVP